MLSNRGHRVGGALIAAALLASPLLMDCGPKGMKGVPGADKIPGGGALPGSCPANIADANALMAANFGLQGELEGKVKAALAAGADLQQIAGDVEAEVTTACSTLAKDLGATDADVQAKEQGPGKKAEAACGAAAKFINDFKAKAKGNLKVEVKPPRCSASMDVVADCAAKCDANVKPGSAKVECEGGKISGECSGKCDGECDVQAGAKCDGSCSGECSGECSADISGKCDGTCEGKCDGKDSKGKCAGQCDGKCKGNAKATCGGTCKGTCSASCTMQAHGECKGECSGKCDVEMKAPKCSGEVKPPQVSAECKAHCNAKANAKLECHPASVLAKLDGAADMQAATKLKAVLDKDLPAILKVSMGMKGKLENVVSDVKASLEGAEAAVKGGGDAALKVGGCFVGSLKAQADAAVSINVSVKASASASASAGAG
jgi:hypothetical protein